MSPKIIIMLYLFSVGLLLLGLPYVPYLRDCHRFKYRVPYLSPSRFYSVYQILLQNTQNTYINGHKHLCLSTLFPHLCELKVWEYVFAPPSPVTPILLHCPVSVPNNYGNPSYCNKWLAVYTWWFCTHIER